MLLIAALFRPGIDAVAVGNWIVVLLSDTDVVPAEMDAGPAALDGQGLVAFHGYHLTSSLALFNTVCQLV